jgi:hypothetical protein
MSLSGVRDDGKGTGSTKILPFGQNYIRRVGIKNYGKDKRFMAYMCVNCNPESKYARTYRFAGMCAMPVSTNV